MYDWQELVTAPRDEAVLVCCGDCTIVIGIQNEIDATDSVTGKRMKIWRWLMRDAQGTGGSPYARNPKMWQPLPLPPKHLYERKLTADLLEKQVMELRS